MSKLAEDFLRPFGGNQVLELHTYALQMQKFGLTADDVIAACEEHIQKALAEIQSAPVIPAEMPEGFSRPEPPKKAMVKCPECGSFCKITPVNVSKCTNIGGPWKTSIECTNKACRFTDLSIKTITEWRHR